AGRLGPTDLTGRLAADRTGPRLALAIDLDAGTLPLDPWLGGGSGKSAEGKRGERWSRDAIDLGGLQKIDAQLTVNAAALTHEDLRIDQARLEASLNDGLLDVKRFAGTFYGGAVQVAGTLDARATPEAGFAVTAIEVDVGALLREQADFDRVAGPVSLNADLTTRGRSEAELISGLTGRGDISGEITVRAKTEEQVGGVLLGILGTQIARVRGLTDVAGLLLNSFAGAPATLTGSFTAERGVLRTRDTRLDGRGAEALTKATVDLPAWTIDSQTDVFQATAPQTPSLTVGLRGPPDDLVVKLGGAALQTPTLPFVQEPAAPAPSGPAPTAPQPSSPAPEPTGPLPVQPEDVIKDLLKGFGG
ncbi:MAG: AsmA family protein, partial [Kiloniellaceae bacterium]